MKLYHEMKVRDVPPDVHYMWDDREKEDFGKYLEQSIA